MERPRVFLSHSSKDKSIVERVRAGLILSGVATWYDLEELDVGDDRDTQIARGIDGSTFVAVFVSRTSLKSKFVQDELRMASSAVRNSRKKLIPILLDDIEDEDLPGYLRGLVYADLRRRDDQAFDTALNMIIRAISRFRGAQVADADKESPLTSVQRLVLMLLAHSKTTEGGVSLARLVEATEMPPDLVEDTLEELAVRGLVNLPRERGAPDVTSERLGSSADRDAAGAKRWRLLCQLLRAGKLDAEDLLEQIENAASIAGVPLESMEALVQQFVDDGSLQNLGTMSDRMLLRAKKQLENGFGSMKDIESSLKELVSAGLVEEVRSDSGESSYKLAALSFEDLFRRWKPSWRELRAVLLLRTLRGDLSYAEYSELYSEIENARGCKDEEARSKRLSELGIKVLGRAFAANCRAGTLGAIGIG